MTSIPKTATRRRASKKQPQKTCSICLKSYPLSEFYASTNILHVDGKIPFCKSCIASICVDSETDEIKLGDFKKILQQIDRPFIEELWIDVVNTFRVNFENSSVHVSKSRIIADYFGRINKYSKYKYLTWEDGINFNKSDNDIVEMVPTATSSNIEENESSEPIKHRSKEYMTHKHYLPSSNFEITDDLLKFYGEGYTTQEYEAMSRIYNNVKEDYPNITSNQKQLLIRYVRLAAKEEIATSFGNISEAEKWSKLASDALKQLNASDIQGGITSFSEFFQKIEREKDIIPILPKYKYRPNDAPDFIIWCYVNYCRRLEGKTECSYEDIYKFYDAKKEEYIKQYGDPYGIFSGDTSEQNREKIEKFIELPPDYYNDIDNVGGEENE